jgi:hypothetical protein
VNAADLATTYLASPDLALEWNVLHSKFNLGWPGLIVAKLIGGTLALLGYAYYLKHRDECYPKPGMDRSAFCRYFSFGRPAAWYEVIAGVPIGPYLGVNLGYFWAGMQLLVFWVALDNVLLHYGWFFPMRHVSELGYHLMQSAVIGVIVLCRFYLGNYGRYSNLTFASLTSRSVGAPAVVGEAASA